MGSNIFIAFIVAVSTTTWLYVRVFKARTKDAGRSLTLAAVVFIIIFFFMFAIARAINPGA